METKSTLILCPFGKLYTSRSFPFEIRSLIYLLFACPISCNGSLLQHCCTFLRIIDHRGCNIFEIRRPICFMIGRPIRIWRHTLQFYCAVLRITKGQVLFCSRSRLPFRLMNRLSVPPDGRSFQFYCKQRDLMDFLDDSIHCMFTRLVRM